MVNDYTQAALERLKAEANTPTGAKEKAMARAVRNALVDFSMQEPEFAQAVVQGGSFADCMKAVAQGVGNAISDSEAFAKAARFYFPGSRVRVVMEIDLVGDAGDDAEKPEQKQEPEKKVAVQLLDLADFF